MACEVATRGMLLSEHCSCLEMSSFSEAQDVELVDSCDPVWSYVVQHEGCQACFKASWSVIWPQVSSTFGPLWSWLCVYVPTCMWGWTQLGGRGQGALWGEGACGNETLCNGCACCTFSQLCLVDSAITRSLYVWRLNWCSQFAYYRYVLCM